MKYQVSKQNGDAGEFYFGYWIAANFGWPCRLLDIDLGIDAQVEICDDTSTALGKFIAVQIKSTQSTAPSVSLELKNLVYWKTMDEPVVVVLITNILGIPKLYWQIINTEAIDNLILLAQENDSKKTQVNFKISDELTPHSKSRFKDLFAIRSIALVQSKAKSLHDQVWDYINPFYNFDDEEYDIHNYPVDDGFIDDFDRFYREFESIESLEYLDILKSRYRSDIGHYVSLFSIMLKLEKLVSHYIELQPLDVVQQWKEPPYHPKLFDLCGNK